MPIISSLGRLGQEDIKFKGRLGTFAVDEMPAAPAGRHKIPAVAESLELMSQSVSSGSRSHPVSKDKVDTVVENADTNLWPPDMGVHIQCTQRSPKSSSATQKFEVSWDYVRLFQKEERKERRGGRRKEK